jgi:hypothetical protein
MAELVGQIPGKGVRELARGYLLLQFDRGCLLVLLLRASVLLRVLLRVFLRLGRRLRASSFRIERSTPLMFEPWQLVLSPDGGNAYVVASLTNRESSPRVLRVLAGDAATGALTALPGSAGCLSAGGAGGCNYMPPAFTGPQTGAIAPLVGPEACTSNRLPACRRGRGLTGSRLLLSPDGSSLYAVASGDAAVAELRSRGL